MKRLLAGAAMVLAVLAGPAVAADSGFTPAQRADIIAIVRDALKTDPSILRDAVTAMQSDDEAREAAAAHGAIIGNKAALFAAADDPIAGNANGDVSLVEFYDPRCPYCRKMLPGIDAMLKQDKGLRLVYKDIPVLGPASVMEARAIVAAKLQGGYLQMQAALMRDPSPPSEDMIRSAAKGIGLNAAKLIADMNGPVVTKKIQANMDLAHALHVQGTPAFVVDEQMIPGAVDTAQLQMAVADARKHAAK
jgi:protein-disulfide isomerase